MMATHKILIPAFDFKPALGGVAHYTHELIESLHQERKFDIRVIAREAPESDLYDSQSSATIYRYPLPNMASAALPLLSIAIGAHIRSFRPDIIFCPLWFPDAAAAELAQRVALTNVPFALAIHGMEVLPSPLSLKQKIREKILSPLHERVFKNCKAAFAVSHYTRDLALRTTALSPEKIHVVNNGVNLKTYKKSSTPGAARQKLKLLNGPLLLTVTRLRAYKGVDKVIETLPALIAQHPELQYIVVGEGTDRSRLDNLVHKMGLEKHVLFLGAIEQSLIIDLYNTADLFILLSREAPGDVEGFGLVFLEAAACGLPSVGGDSGGIPDAIDDGKSGWLVPPTDTKKIAQVLLRVLGSSQERADASTYGLEMVKNRTWSQSAKKITEVLFG